MSRIALIGENSIGYVDKLLDIWNNGDCAVLIDWRTPIYTSIEMMEAANVRICFVEEQLFENWPNDVYSSIKIVPFKRCNDIAMLLPEKIVEKYRPCYRKDEAIVIYSSGTTGLSKGIILSHYAISTNADAIIEYMKPNHEDCMAIVKHFSHSSTITGELLVGLKSGMRLVIAPTIVPPRHILNNIEKFGVSLLCLNPTLLSLICDEVKRTRYALKTLKKVYVSGSILSDKIYEKAQEIFCRTYNIPLYNVYGLSEASPRVTAQRKDCCKSNSVGKPIKDIAIVIVNEKGQEVVNGEVGILHVNTPSLFSGYILGETKHNSLYMDWLNTGDIGYLDTEGELHVVSRLDDVIIIDSHKIYPNEVEKLISKIEGISECAVTKIDFPNIGFLACLYVGNIVSELTIRNYLRDKLLPHEIPRRFIRCDSLPRTLNGKISTHEMQKYIIKEINEEGLYDNK